jgi:nucleoside-diphosphate-sugar epimerase
MKKILITGGNGYIAKKLAIGLLDYNIDIITKIDLDLTDENACRIFFRDKSYDVIIHTAIQGGSRLKVDDDSVLEKNLKMYFNLMNYAVKNARFISFGSGAEKGYPTDPYGLSKYVIAQSMLTKPNCYNIRIYAVFDHDELDTRFIKTNVKRYINKKDMLVYQNKYMDFFYMEDLISVVNYYVKENTPISKEFDCTYLETKTLYQIAELINHLDEHKVEIRILDDRSGKDYNGSWHGIELPLVGLEQGIRNSYNIIKTKQ